MQWYCNDWIVECLEKAAKLSDEFVFSCTGSLGHLGITTEEEAKLPYKPNDSGYLKKGISKIAQVKYFNCGVPNYIKPFCLKWKREQKKMLMLMNATNGSCEVWQGNEVSKKVEFRWFISKVRVSSGKGNRQMSEFYICDRILHCLLCILGFELK